MFEQERFIGRLQRHVLADPTIVACYLGGSFGRRTEDAYSDVDVNLVYADEFTREAAWARRSSFVSEVMPYVPVRSYDAAHVRPYLYITLYSNGTKVDVLFVVQAEHVPNAREREIRILKDTSGWAERHQAESARLALSLPYLSSADLAAIDDRFWGTAWDVLRMLKRGEAGKPFIFYLRLLNFSVPPLLGALPPEDPAYQGLLAASYSRDTQATIRGVSTFIDAYLAARAAVVRRQNLAFTPNTAFETEIRRQIDRLVR